MTSLLASIRDLDEARQAFASGADIIDCKDPDRGALGALPAPLVATVKAALGSSVPVSATVGDLPLQPVLQRAAIMAMAATGVDYVKLGLFCGAAQADCARALARPCAAGVPLIVVLFADQQPDFEQLLPLLAAAGCRGVMLDTADKAAGGLRQHGSLAMFQAFVHQARDLGLLTGLAGSLRAADVSALQPLGADYLGFRGALCDPIAGRGGRLDSHRLARLRALLPRSMLPPAVIDSGSALTRYRA